MSNSYRLRTQVGVDKTINVQLEQDFEFLEVLSLKITQSQIYTRQCSDYGVIVGRLTANDGFGIPNARISVFIPLSDEDENNPIISDLYPYRSLTTLNEDGFRYNLLPKTQSHSGHIPTGSFFDKEDVLLNPNYIEVFDKYYKFTTLTNDSGDYMIFGVPVGSQTIHVDVDLSDIGEFSLSPQDLIRMGIATEAQVAGTKFRKSTNLNELPQIISFNRTLEVVPLWGQPEVCNLGITRTDFDLATEANVTITPTAIFMGSIISSNDKDFQKRNCKPKSKQGELCNMVTGPGEILTIRQTIFEDELGRPILETYDLESGGQVIDENGTWLLDVPMNLDYVITNEFGERVLSNDPKKGIPTKGKYRFKIKWNQSPKLSEPIKRGYFLVPNIKEYGWNNTGTIDPIKDTNLASIDSITAAEKSYAFSVDWNDYGDTGTTIGNIMIDEAINCEDKFYPMIYNKVYTTTQLIDQYRNGYLPNRIISIKNITDETCESENVRFPTNDAVYRFDLLYLLFIITLFIFRPILFIFLHVAHFLAGLLKFFGDSNWKRIAFMEVPNLTYPECDLCQCKEGRTAVGNGPSEYQLDISLTLAEGAYLTPLSLFSSYNTTGPLWNGEFEDNILPSRNLTFDEQRLLSGDPYDPAQPSPRTFAPQMIETASGKFLFTTSTPMFERMNNFNLKASYFDGDITRFWNDGTDQWEPTTNNVRNSYNPTGGGNRIRVSFRPSLNGYSLPPGEEPSVTSWYNVGINSPWHLDNVVVLLVKPSKIAELRAGTLVAFQSSQLSTDPNLTGFTQLNQFGLPSITGTTINPGTNLINVDWANPNGSGNETTAYLIDQGTNDAEYAKFPMDIEYFQVITSMTIGDYQDMRGNGGTLNQDSGQNLPGTLGHALFTRNNIVEVNRNGNSFNQYRISAAQTIEDFDRQGIVFLVRGVDPYSTRGEVEYDLSNLFNGSVIYNQANNNCNLYAGCIDTESKFIIRGNNYKLNIPIQGTIRNIRHDFSDVNSIDVSTNQYLYHQSYHFQPSTSGLGSFIPFNSILPRHYSLLDTSTPSGYLTNARPLWDFTNNSSLDPFLRLANDYTQNYSTYPPVNVKNLKNVFQIEFRRIYPLAAPGLESPILNGDARGGISAYRSPNVYYRSYWSNQVVEGGTAMLQIITLNGSGSSTIGPNVSVNPPPPGGVSYYYAPWYGLYNINYEYTTQLAQDSRIIMRSDRLPTSTSYIQNQENVYPLFTNPLFSVYTVTDEGFFDTSSSNPVGTPSFNFSAQTIDESISGLSILNTFNCDSMLPLSCYYNSGGEISFYEKPNNCYTNGLSGDKNEEIIDKGCYVFITAPFSSLQGDIRLLWEWTSRLQITFAACRNVWSHTFTNNWVNGVLYMFAFKNERFFNSQNEPFSEYCKDTIYLNSTNNFYYRSSPYSVGLPNPLPLQGRFVGSPRPTSGSFLGFTLPSYGGNNRNLKFPTSMVDLGPRSQYLQELVFSDDYDGFLMNRLTETTFQDVSEILNVFILNRLSNSTFIQLMRGQNGANVTTFFDKRDKAFVDGDYAQMLSISSELGVVEFEASSYQPIQNGQDPLYFNSAGSIDPIFGIFFSSDSQTRDYLTPKRTIINGNISSAVQCGFNYFTSFSQVVPFYQWQIKRNNGQTDSIFGSQSNNWYTNRFTFTYPDNVNTYSSFYSHRYQSLDRLLKESRYYRPSQSGGATATKYFKGYIYSVDLYSNPQVSPDYEWQWNGNSDPNNPEERIYQVGAPFHFYFGLKKGKTAFDRFIKKWLDFNNLVE